MGRQAKGSVRLKNGKWIAELRGEHLGSYDTEDAAWRKIDAALKIDSDKAPDSLRVFSETWFLEREEGGDVRGISSERSVWTNHIATAEFFDWPMKKVRAVDIDRHWVKLSKKLSVIVTRSKGAAGGIVKRKGTETLSRQTIVHARRLLLACFASAAAQGKVNGNPVRDSKVPKMAQVIEEEDEWSFLFAEEIARLFAAIEAIVPADTSRLKPKTLARLEQRRAFYRAVYAVAIYGGLRQGEVFGLHWEDVSFDANQIHVRRLRGGGPLKTASSKRRVPMLRAVREALDAWRRHGGVVKTHGILFPSDGGTVGGSERGGYFGDSYDASWETRWRAKATERGYVTFHDLRHTCCSHLAMGTWGKPLRDIEIATWAGHSDLKTTKRYMHLAPDSLNEMVRQMEAPDAPLRLVPPRR